MKFCLLLDEGMEEVMEVGFDEIDVLLLFLVGDMFVVCWGW